VSVCAEVSVVDFTVLSNWLKEMFYACCFSLLVTIVFFIDLACGFVVAFMTVFCHPRWLKNVVHCCFLLFRPSFLL